MILVIMKVYLKVWQIMRQNMSDMKLKISVTKMILMIPCMTLQPNQLTKTLIKILGSKLMHHIIITLSFILMNQPVAPSIFLTRTNNALFIVHVHCSSNVIFVEHDCGEQYKYATDNQIKK